MVEVKIILIDQAGQEEVVSLLENTLSAEEQKAISEQGALQLTNKQLGALLQRNQMNRNSSRITE